MAPHGHDCINSVTGRDFADKVNIRVVVVVRTSRNVDHFVCHADVFSIRAHVFRCRHHDKLNLVIIFDTMSGWFMRKFIDAYVKK